MVAQLAPFNLAVQPIEPPSVIEELNRKVNESLTNILHRMNTGEISPPEARIALEAVWMVCSGLIEKQFMDAIAAVANQLPARKFDCVFFGRYGSPIYTLIREIGVNSFTVYTATEIKVVECQTHEDALVQFTKMIDILSKTYQRWH